MPPRTIPTGKKVTTYKPLEQQNAERNGVSARAEGEVAQSAFSAMYGNLGREPENPDTFETTIENRPPVKWEEEEQYPDFYSADAAHKDPLGVLHKEYRGQDKFVNEGKFTTAFETSNRYALLRVENPFTGALETYSTPAFSSEKEVKYGKLAFNLDSQVPSVKFRISLQGDGAPDDTNNSLALSSILQAAKRANDTRDAEVLEEPKSKGELWRVSFDLMDDGQVPKYGPSGRPIWWGAKVGVVEDCARRYKEAPETMHERERCVGALYHAKVFSFYCSHVGTDDKGKLNFQRFKEFVQGSWYMTATLGSFWWYQLQVPEIDIESADFPFHKIKGIPRWLVTEWKVIVKNGEDIVSAEPHTWESFRMLHHYPDSRTFGFIMALGLNRAIMTNRKHIDTATAFNPGAEMATWARLARGLRENVMIDSDWFANPLRKGEYLVHGYVMDLEAVLLAGFKIPDLKRLATVGVHVDGRDVWYRGVTVPDFKNSKAHIVLYVRGEDIPGLTRGSHDISLTLKANDIPVNRMLNALGSLREGQESRDGPYMPDIALMAPSPLDQQPDAIARYFVQYPECALQYRSIVEKANLDTEQEHAAMEVIRSGTGLTLVIGPPGSGKTRMSMVVVLALAQCGIRVLVTAGSNAAVEALMTEFEKVKGDFPGYKYAHFRHAYYHVRNQRSEHRTPQHADPMNEDQVAPDAPVSAADRKKWRAITRLAGPGVIDSKKLGFATKKLTLAKAWTTMEPSETDRKGQVWKEMFSEYLAVLGRMNNPLDALPRQERKDLFADFEEKDMQATAAVLMDHMMIIFCTHGSSCHDALFACYKPWFLLSDDAARSTPPDQFVPMAVNKETLGGMMLVGGYMGPVQSARNRSEASNVMGRSLFEHLIISRKKPTHWLTTQYRR